MFSDFSRIFRLFFFMPTLLKIVFGILSVEHSTRDFMINSDFQKKTFHYFRLSLFNEPDFHPCIG